MVNTASTNSSIITADALPAILIGGPPNAGKSVLTYNLTRELRRREIPHYVFRANPDIEGDWFLQGDVETVRQIQLKVSDYRHWTNIFREFVCRDLAHRYLPLIVDLGGLPRDADNCIFQVCTHSILLLKDEDEEVAQTWRRYATTNGLRPLAELRSQLEGDSILTAKEPIVTGTITGLVRGVHLHNTVFDALLEQVSQLFRSFTLDAPDQLEKFHLDNAPIEFKVHLLHQLQALAPDTDEWTSDMLQPLLTQIPAQTAMAVYGRAPIWVYGALALHAGTQPFHQFDARLGWVTPPPLQASASGQSSQELIYINKENQDDAYVILIHPIHNYLDYREADQLVLPEPPPQRGVVVSGKLPLWLFTALARFYAQRDVPWIALNDARDNRPIVIYSQVGSHPIGKILPKLV
jgi:CRISPR-associated protein Csx3